MNGMNEPSNILRLQTLSKLLKNLDLILIGLREQQKHLDLCSFIPASNFLIFPRSQDPTTPETYF
jgi:hypothetical protein